MIQRQLWFLPLSAFMFFTLFSYKFLALYNVYLHISVSTPRQCMRYFYGEVYILVPLILELYQRKGDSEYITTPRVGLFLLFWLSSLVNSWLQMLRLGQVKNLGFSSDSTTLVSNVTLCPIITLFRLYRGFFLGLNKLLRLVILSFPANKWYGCMVKATWYLTLY